MITEPIITLRQYYAGLMLQGMIGTHTAQDDYLANRAVKLADILIEQLNNPTNNTLKKLLEKEVKSKAIIEYSHLLRTQSAGSIMDNEWRKYCTINRIDGA